MMQSLVFISEASPSPLLAINYSDSGPLNHYHTTSKCSEGMRGQPVLRVLEVLEVPLGCCDKSVLLLAQFIQTRTKSVLKFQSSLDTVMNLSAGFVTDGLLKYVFIHIFTIFSFIQES